MTEQEARARIIAWAKEHFAGKTTPEVEVVGIHYDAQLSVSSSIDNPYVSFEQDDRYEHGIQISQVEY